MPTRTLPDYINSLFSLINSLFSLPLSDTEERQSRDWRIAHQCMDSAVNAVNDGNANMAIAHALIGILALQRSDR